MLDQQLVRFCPNAFVAVNQEKLSDIIQGAQFCVVSLQERERLRGQEGHLLQPQPTCLALLGWLVSTSLAIAIHLFEHSYFHEDTSTCT